MKYKNGLCCIEDRPPTEEELETNHANLSEETKAFVERALAMHEKLKQENQDK